MLYGIVTDPNDVPYENALIEVKGEDFCTLFSAATDANGRYSLDLPDGVYPFVTAVKDYAVTCLECWVHDLPVSGDTRLDLRFESLEVYGLNVFQVRGGHPSLHLYFRPMSLAKFREGVPDIAPDIDCIRILIDGSEVAILQCSKVGEYADGRVLTAYLLQAALPAPAAAWRRIDLEITDTDGHFGMAMIFA